MAAPISKPITSLPDWAFRGLAMHTIETLIDRTEHETIVITRKGRPDLVLVSHDDWVRLTAGQHASQASTEPGENKA